MRDDKTFTGGKPIIVIGERPDVVPGQTEGEVPVITIEESADTPTAEANKRSRKWPTVFLAVVASSVAFVLLYGIWLTYRYFFDFGVPVGTSTTENIAKLKRISTRADKDDNIVVTCDSILGVAMNFYELHNLKAEIMLTRPDTADTSILLCTRCADYTADGRYLGSLVAGGKELQTDRSRVGYCAMANGNTVIGISRSERVKDYCEERGGSFFRQFVLVSDGVLPSRFVLHGKVERRALGRMADDRLYIIETRHKETLWDFADALREYGFVDAIYLTGGTSRSWYRSGDNKLHYIGDMNEPVKGNLNNKIPWLVFRKRF